MQSPALDDSRPGPLLRTALELGRIERLAAFRRARRLTPRRRLEHADALLGLVEECRLRRYRLLPPSLWVEVVRFVGDIDPALRDLLGINRHPDHVSEVLFSVQQQLMERCIAAAHPGPAVIIPLFPAPAASA